MKKVLIQTVSGLAMVILMAVTVNAQDTDGTFVKSTPSFQLLLTGNLGLLTGNSDMNDETDAIGQGVADYYNAVAAKNKLKGGFTVSDSSKADMSLGGELEMRFFGDSFGFGLGSGLHYTESTAKVTSPNWADSPEYTLSLVVIPVMGTLYYIHPVSQNSFLTVGAGVGYYFGFLDGILENTDPRVGNPDVPEPMADGTTFGYHLKADYNIMFGPLSLTAGVMGRIAQFDTFEEDGYEYDFKAGLSGVEFYIGAGIAI